MEAIINREWKEKNQEYLKSLQKFLDSADNIKEESIKRSVIIEMLKCDEILTRLAEQEIENNSIKTLKKIG